MSPVSLSEVEGQIESLVAELNHHYKQLAVTRSELRSSEQKWQAEAAETAAGATGEAKKALERNRKAIEANADELQTTALGIAARSLSRHAGDYLSADWNDDVWGEMPAPKGGQWLRVGMANTGVGDLPVALPLSAGVWSVSGGEGDQFKVLVHNVIARVAAAFDPPRIQVTAYDPELVLDLAVFADLRAISMPSLPPAIASEEELEQALERLRSDITALDDRLTAAGQDTFWKALAAGHALAGSTPLRILIIADEPLHLSDRGRARLDQICRLAADRGLLVIECAAKAAVNRATSNVVIALKGNTATASCLPGVTWTPDPWVGDTFIRALGAKLRYRLRESLAPTLALESIVDRIVDPWMSDTDQGIETVIGSTDTGDLLVRLRSENPPMPNALIGGAVGQGKSNLLLVLIHGLAAKYSPAELEMLLVDLRDGVEFARLGPSSGSATWLPHVRALGLEFDSDYCVAVLRWVRDEMTRRSTQLKASGATTLHQYHETTGEVMPRLLVVIDEFQRLFEGDDEQAVEAAAQLDSIARTGRGFGVHLVLASQAITGIRGLATRSEAIFGQFHNRVTLRNTPAESQAFLTAQNLAATELEHRGQVVVNDSLGAIDANHVGTVAHADPRYLEQLQVRLFQQGHGGPPSVFRASAFAEWPQMTGHASVSSGVGAVVGLPIAVEAAPRGVQLSRAPNQCLAVVGGDRAVAIPVLTRAVSSAVESLKSGARVTILDAESDGVAASPWIAALITNLEQLGAQVERVERKCIAKRLIGFGDQPAELVVAIALDSTDLTTPVGPGYLVPSESLRELVRIGPLSGTWMVGWWQSASILDEHLGYRAPGVRAWALCGVSNDDLTSICGPAVRAPTATPRFVWFDRTGGRGAERLIPFAATDVLGGLGFD